MDIDRALSASFNLLLRAGPPAHAAARRSLMSSQLALGHTRAATAVAVEEARSPIRDAVDPAAQARTRAVLLIAQERLVRVLAMTG